MRRLILFLYAAMICISCNYFNSSETQKTVKVGIAEANDSLKQNYINERTSLKTGYQNILSKIKDTTISIKINVYYSDLNGLIAHMDSLKKDVDMDIFTTKNSSVFISNDTKYDLFLKIRKSYVLASGIARTDQRRREIAKSKENLLFSPDTKELVDFYFGQNEAQQETWMLYGFESELMKVGIDCFKDYNH